MRVRSRRLLHNQWIREGTHFLSVVYSSADGDASLSTLLYSPFYILSYPILFYPILFCPTLSYPILPYSVLSYPILPYPILSWPILFYPILFCPILFYPILPYPTLPYPILPYPIVPPHTLPWTLALNSVRVRWWSHRNVCLTTTCTCSRSSNHRNSSGCAKLGTYVRELTICPVLLWYLYLSVSFNLCVYLYFSRYSCFYSYLFESKIAFPIYLFTLPQSFLTVFFTTHSFDFLSLASSSPSIFPSISSFSLPYTSLFSYFFLSFLPPKVSHHNRRTSYLYYVPSDVRCWLQRVHR